MASTGFYFSLVRKIDLQTGLISTPVGCTRNVGCAQGANVLAADYSLFQPVGLAFDRSGNMYVSLGYCCVMKVDALTTRLSFFAGYSGSPPAGVLPGQATLVSMNPGALAIDQNGGRNYLYIADYYEHLKVYRVDLNTGVLTTYAGNGSYDGPLGDGGPATQASLSRINDLAVDEFGNLYIATTADYPKGWIRKVDFASGMIYTIAGGGLDFGDYILADTAAILPHALAFDPTGRLFFVEAQRGGVFTINAANRIVRVAGKAGDAYGFSGDNGLAISARFRAPGYMTFDSAGNLFIVDQGNNRIRAIRGPIP